MRRSPCHPLFEDAAPSSRLPGLQDAAVRRNGLNKFRRRDEQINPAANRFFARVAINLCRRRIPTGDFDVRVETLMMVSPEALTIAARIATSPSARLSWLMSRKICDIPTTLPSRS